MTPNSLHARDIASLVHQQTNLDQHARDGAVIIERGEGCRVWDSEGREYIEAMAGLWCASLGFSERRLADAAHKQMLELPYYHTFFQKGHTPAVELAEKLLQVAPAGMRRVLFQCSGSEANDAAIKLAWLYWGIQGAAGAHQDDRAGARLSRQHGGQRQPVGAAAHACRV